MKFGSLKKRLRKLPGSVEIALAEAVEIEPQLIPAEPVAAAAVVPVSTAIGVAQARARSAEFSKTPSQKRKRAPARKNLRATLVRDLRKRKRELTKELGQVKRDLKSLRAK